jgi:hypothetical protein
MRFEALKERLLRGGIAPRRVRRYLAELDDHLADLTEQERAAGHDAVEAAVRARAMLGDDAELAQAWLSNPRLKSFAAKAPWAVFILAPPFVLLLAFMVPTLSLVVIGRSFSFIGPHHNAAPAWFQQATAILITTINLLLPVLLAALLNSIAARQRLSAAWPLIGIAIIALLGMQIHIGFPTSGQDRGRVMLGMLVFAGRGPAIYWQILLAQWSFLLVFALWIMVTRRRLAPSNQTWPHL